MAEISQEQAQMILERNGYTVSDYLGGGAASHAFKASRKSKKDPTKEKEVAAKVCCPQFNSWASLTDELKAAEELKELKKDFKSKLEKAKREGQGELVKEYEKKLKYFFKYLTVPKLKLELPDATTDDGKKLEVAVFEAPLADSDLWGVVDIDPKTYQLGREPNPYWKGENRTVVSNLSVNYSNLKKVIKGILKGLKLVHDAGKSHGDIRLSNILKKPGASEGKYRYSVTDFGTLKPDKTGEWRKIDLKQASRVLLAMWLRYLCADEGEISNVIRGEFDSYCKTLLEGGSTIPVRVPPDYDECLVGVYYPTNDDKKLITFCQRLYEGKELKSADDALADPWLK